MPCLAATRVRSQDISTESRGGLRLAGAPLQNRLINQLGNRAHARLALIIRLNPITPGEHTSAATSCGKRSRCLAQNSSRPAGENFAFARAASREVGLSAVN